MESTPRVICHVLRELEPVNGKEQQVTFTNDLFL